MIPQSYLHLLHLSPNSSAFIAVLM